MNINLAQAVDKEVNALRFVTGHDLSRAANEQNKCRVPHPSRFLRRVGNHEPHLAALYQHDFTGYGKTLLCDPRQMPEQSRYSTPKMLLVSRMTALADNFRHPATLKLERISE